MGVPFVIIQNDSSDPVIGTFAGLAEGALFKFSGRQWKITYQGGDGNDVMLTLKSLQLPLSLDSIPQPHISNSWILKGNGDPADQTYIMQSSPDPTSIMHQTNQVEVLYTRHSEECCAVIPRAKICEGIASQPKSLT